MPQLHPAHFRLGWESARLASGRNERLTLDRTVWVEALDNETRFHGSDGDKLYVRAVLPSVLGEGEAPWRHIIGEDDKQFANIVRLAGKIPGGGLTLDAPESVIIRPKGRKVTVTYSTGVQSTTTSLETWPRDVEWPQQLAELYERHTETESDMVSRTRACSWSLLAKLETLMAGHVVLEHGSTSARFRVDHPTEDGVYAVGVIDTKLEG